MNIFIVDVENIPGEIARAAGAIARKGINITAFSGISAGASSKLALITSDEVGTRQALAEAGYVAREIEVVTTTLEHAPGTLAMTAGKLADAGINIEVVLPTSMSGGNVTLAFATDQPGEARRILSSAEPVVWHETPMYSQVDIDDPEAVRVSMAD